MVAIVSAAGLGVFNGTASALGLGGASSLGQAGGQALVNVATGNLIVQFTDEQLSGTGADLFHSRTYNAQGTANDGDGDQWRWGGERRVQLTGTRNAAGSTVSRTTGDGHVSTFAWNGSAYTSTDGGGAHDSISWNGSAWVWTEGSSRNTETYDGSTGWIVNSRDRNGNGFDFTFTGNLLTGVRDIRSGQRLALIYGTSGTSNGRLVRLDTYYSTSNSTNATVREQSVYYSYDSLGRLSTVKIDLTPSNNSITDNAVYQSTYTYDGSSLRVASITQSDGTAVSYTYTSVGGQYRVSTVSDQNGLTTFSYDTAARRTDVTNGAGDTWQYYYNSQQELTQVRSQVVGGVQQSMTYTYENGAVKTATDSLNNRITYTYDARGNVITEVDAESNRITRTYSSTNQLLTETRYASGTSGSPETTRFVYNSAQNLRYTINAEGGVIEHDYNAHGLVVRTTTYAANAYNVSALGTTSVPSEATMNAWVNTQPKDKVEMTEYLYDYRGNLQKKTAFARVNTSGAGIADNGVSVTHYVYSQHGQLLNTVVQHGSVSTTVETLVYDGMGRVIDVVGPNGSIKTFYHSGYVHQRNETTGLNTYQYWNSKGQVERDRQYVAAGNERNTRYSYDAAGRLTETLHPTGGKTTLVYDAAGRVKYRVNADNRAIGYTYDASGRVTKEVAFSSSFDHSSNTVASVASADRETRYTYNKIGQVLTTTQENGSADVVTAYVYDDAGRLMRTTVGGDRVTRYFYNKAGQQVGVLNAEGFLTEQVRDAAGRVVKTVRYSSEVTGTVFASGTLTSVRDVADNSDELFQHFFYDAQGRQVGVVNEQGYLVETIFEPALKRTRTIQYLSVITVSDTDTLASARARATVGGYLTRTQHFDHHGRLAMVTDIDNSTTQYSYDSAGRLIRTIEQVTTTQGEAAQNRLSYSEYNAYGEIVGAVSGEGAKGLSTGALSSVATVRTAVTQAGERFVYNNQGLLTQQLGPNGQKTLYFYDSQGRLTYTVNALGNVSKSVYSAFGELASTHLYKNAISTAGLVGGVQTSTLINRANAAAGFQVSFAAYNQLGKVSVDDSVGYTTFHYDKYGDLFKQAYRVTSTAYRETVFTRDKLGREISALTNDGLSTVTTSRHYDGFGRIDSVTDARNYTTTTNYHGNSNKITVTDAGARQHSTEYDALGREVTITDALGKVTRYSYNNTARSVTVTSPEGIAITSWRNQEGDVLAIKDGNGNTRTFTYDLNGNQTEATDANNKTSLKRYDASQRLIEVRDANNNVVTFDYDAANRTTLKTIDPSGLNIRTQYVFDGAGRQFRVTAGYGSSAASTTEYTYVNDKLDKVVVDKGGLNLETRYEYDSYFETVKRTYEGTVGMADSQRNVTEYVYDRFGRLAETIRDVNTLKYSTQNRYDAAGNLTRTIDPRGNSTWFIYNATGELSLKVDAEGGVVQYEYDKNGRLHHTRELYNRVSAATLSSLGNQNAPTSIAMPSPNAQDRRSYTVYDDNGRQRYTLTATSSTNWSVTETLYDNNNNVIETRRYDKYIAEGRINARAGSGITVAEVRAELNSLGRLSSLGATQRTRFAYDAVNRLRFTVNALGAVTENVYDSVGNVLRQTEFVNVLTSTSATLADINAKVNRALTSNRTKEFVYDKANRLVDEYTPTTTFQNSAGTSYTNARIKTHTVYDAIGNVKARHEGIIVTSSGSEVTSDRRITTYEYDKAGRQTRTILAGWFDTTDDRVYKDKSGQSDRFQRTIDVTYDAFGNAIVNKIKVGPGSSDYVRQYKTYDKLGREIHDIDGLGHVTKKAYDGLGNITQLTRYSKKGPGQSSDTGWTVAQVNASIANDSLARTIVSEYNALGQVVKTVQNSVSQNHTTVSTATTNLQTARSYTAAPTTTYQYNTFGERVSQSSKIDTTRWATSYSFYDRIGRQTAAVDAGGYVTQSDYNVFGNLSKSSEFANAYTAAISVDNQPAITTGSRSSKDRILHYHYDAMGRETRVLRDNMFSASGAYGSSYTMANSVSISQTGYNTFGEVRTVTDANGNTTTSSYNNLGQVISVLQPVRTIAGVATDPFKSQVSASPRSSFTYSTFGDVTKIIHHANIYGSGATITTSQVFDHVGNAIQSIDGRGNITYSAYDVTGNVTETRTWASTTSGPITYNHNVRQIFEYDVTGRQIATMDVFGNNLQSGQRVTYNAFGEVQTESMVYGSYGASLANLTQVITKSYAYDKVGRVTSTRGAEGYTHYYYDLANRVTRSEHRGTTNSTSGARVTEHYYDILGRVEVSRQPFFYGTAAALSENLVRLTPKIRQTYDRWGNTLSRTDAANATFHYAYDHANRLIQETTPNVMVYGQSSNSDYQGKVVRSIHYDKVGNAIYEKHQAYTTGGTLKSTKGAYKEYNQVGQEVKSVDETGKAIRYAYDLHGNQVGKRTGSGITHVSDYNANNELVKVSLLRNGASGVYTGSQTSSPTKVRLAEYQYDQVGRKYAELDAAGSALYYAFDARGKLIRSSTLLGGQNTYVYDVLGNKTAEYIDHRVTVGTTLTGSRLVNAWEYLLADYQSDRIYKRHASRMENEAVAEKFTYSYSRFGQLAREQSSVNTDSYIGYSYKQNGMLAIITDRQLLSASGYEINNSSIFQYDIRGNRSVEQNLTRQEWVQDVPYGGTVGSSSVTSAKTLYSYDTLNRLSTVKSPAGSVRFGSGTADRVSTTSQLNSLSYRYDQWGNRRAVSASYQLPASSEIKTRTEWYTYDAAGRVLVEDGFRSNGQIVAGKQDGVARGKVYTYDSDGRRATEQVWHWTKTPYGTVPGAENFDQRVFRYNDLSLVHTEQKRTVSRTYNGNSHSAITGTTAYAVVENNTYDSLNRGFKTRSITGGGGHGSLDVYTTYNLAGNVTYQQTHKYVAQSDSSVAALRTSASHNYQYDVSGSLLKYQTLTYNDSGNYQYTNTYEYRNGATRSGYQVFYIKVTSTQDNRGIGSTDNRYDSFGRLYSSNITQVDGNWSGPGSRYFAYNSEGKVISRLDRNFRAGTTNTYELQSYYYKDGAQLADIGDLGVNITPLSALYQGGNTPGSYTINSGDSLFSIAQSIFGDGSLWYTLAEANGLTVGPTDRLSDSEVGRTIRIPNTDKSIANTSTNFKPYDPGAAIGDLTPQPTILPPPKGGCNKIATIVMVVVAVIVTVYTAGAAAGAMGAATTAGGTATAGSFAAAYGTTTAVISGAVGGFAGSVASQLVGKALGVVDSFSLRQAVSSGIAGGVTAGVGSGLMGQGQEGILVAKGAERLSALGQGIQGAASIAAGTLSNKIAGLRTQFSWSSVAAGAIGGAVSGGLGINGSVNPATNQLSPGGFLKNFALGFSNSAISSSARRLMGGVEQDWGAIAADSFGNALGQGVAAKYDLAGIGRRHGRAVSGRTGGSGAGSGNQTQTPVLTGLQQSDKNEEENNASAALVVADAVKAMGETVDRVSQSSSERLEESVAATQRDAEINWQPGDWNFSIDQEFFDGVGAALDEYSDFVSRDDRYLKTRDLVAKTDAQLAYLGIVSQPNLSLGDYGEQALHMVNEVAAYIAEPVNLTIDLGHAAGAFIYSETAEFFTGNSLTYEATFRSITGRLVQSGASSDMVRREAYSSNPIGSIAVGLTDTGFGIFNGSLNQTLGGVSTTLFGVLGVYGAKVGPNINLREGIDALPKFRLVPDSSFMRGKFVGTVDESFTGLSLDQQIGASFSRIESAFGSSYAAKTRELFESVRLQNFNHSSDLGMFSVSGKSPSIHLNNQIGNADVMALTILHETRHLRQFNKVADGLNLDVPMSTYGKVLNHYRARDAWNNNLTTQQKEVFATSTNVWQANRLGLSAENTKIFSDYFDFWRN